MKCDCPTYEVEHTVLLSHEGMAWHNGQNRKCYHNFTSTSFC